MKLSRGIAFLSGAALFAFAFKVQLLPLEYPPLKCPLACARRCSGSLLVRMEMKIRLAIPNTTSMTIKVARAADAAGSEKRARRFYNFWLWGIVIEGQVKVCPMVACSCGNTSSLVRDRPQFDSAAESQPPFDGLN